MKKSIILAVLILSINNFAFAENLAPAVVQQPIKTQPANNFPKPAYYENGIPVYYHPKVIYNDRKTAPQRTQNDNFPHYKGVKN